MKYNPKSDSVEIDLNNLKMAYLSLVYAIRQIRIMANLPLDKHKRDGVLEPSDHAQRAIIQAAEAIGINMGAEWGEQLDVRIEQ